MKNGIPSNKYYFLLGWKDGNMDEYLKLYGERRLTDLDVYELNTLYESIVHERDPKQHTEAYKQIMAKVPVAPEDANNNN